jgi:lipopolysaccharide/colanic/teichoic acid biosynthesis glycosyltransferase
MAGPDPERTYREEVLPAKLRLDAEYLDRQSLRLDLAILARTVLAVAGRGGAGRVEPAADDVLSGR